MGPEFLPGTSTTFFGYNAQTRAQLESSRYVLAVTAQQRDAGFPGVSSRALELFWGMYREFSTDRFCVSTPCVTAPGGVHLTGVETQAQRSSDIPGHTGL